MQCQAALVMGNKGREERGFWRRWTSAVRALLLAKQDASESEEGGDSAEAARAAAADMLRTHGNAVLKAAYAYLHNLSDAEDILQDTLIQWMRTRPRFESGEHEKAWLLRVAINLSKNKLKSSARRRTEELPESLADEREDLSFVWEAVQKLPEKYRGPVHLYYYEGYSGREVAELLGKKETTVRSLLMRARQMLRAELKEEYDFDQPEM